MTGSEHWMTPSKNRYGNYEKMMKKARTGMVARAGASPIGVHLSTAVILNAIVILSAAKDLTFGRAQILRCAQDDKWRAGRPLSPRQLWGGPPLSPTVFWGNQHQAACRMAWHPQGPIHPSPSPVPLQVVRPAPTPSPGGGAVPRH